MSAGVILLLAVTIAATSFLSGIFGMAGGMLLMGVLVAFFSVPAAMVVHAITQMAANGWRAVLWRAHVDGRIVLRYLAGLLAATAIFAAIDYVPSRAVVLISIGIAPFIGLTVPLAYAPRIDRAGGAELAGFIGGALQLLSGVSGPALDMFFVRTAIDRRGVVATKASCQVLTHLAKLIYFGGLASDGWEEIDLPLLPGAVLLAIAGTTLARGALERMSNAQFRRWTRWIVLALGGFYLVLGLRALAAG